MKKLIILSAGLFMTAFLTMSTTSILAQKSDEAAIKKVLNQMTSDYFHKNYDAWAAGWVHDTATTHTWIGPGYYTQLNGWNSISKQGKQSMQALPSLTEAEIADRVKKDDLEIHINGNMAIASFNYAFENVFTDKRTLIKQNGSWKVLDVTSVPAKRFDLIRIMNNMKVFVGKWVLDGSVSEEPDNGRVLNSAEFVLRETPTGLEQTSRFIYTNSKGVTSAPPTDYEYFIPDYGTGKIFYLGVEKNHSGLTFTETGTIASEKTNSFTVTTTYPDKPNAKRVEYTVTLENGKWHQIAKRYDENGKVIGTEIINLKRL